MEQNLKGEISMRDLTPNEIYILYRHSEWVESNGAQGKRADLRGACLDDSCWPLWCGATDVKIDDRIVAQLLFHLTRLDDSVCSSGVREAMSHIRSMAIADLFCEYRNDVPKLVEE